jgi:molybdenum-dependent DNA-binding transcriptional regulator ModE
MTMNTSMMPGVALAPAMAGFIESANRMTAQMNQFKALAESPNIKALQNMGDKYREQLKILRQWAQNPKHRMEMHQFRKQVKGAKLGAFLHKVIREVEAISARALTVINVKTQHEDKTGRERMMALRGLAQSCAPNSERVSDMYLAMVATRRFA